MSPDVLTGGTWSPDRHGVLRWTPATDEPPAVRDLSLLIACPFCCARVTQTCRSRGGNPVHPHTTRLAPRLCPCGAALPWKRQLCRACATEARRQTYRRREQRVPTRERRKEAA